MQQLDEKIVFSVTRRGWLDRLAQNAQRAVNRVFHSGPAARGVKDFLNGTWFGHPMHPAATDVPVGAWTTSFVLDGVETLTGRDMSRASSTAIGIGVGGAVVAAASGVADWSDTGNDQRRVGLVHALFNIVALTLYGASLWRRLSGRRSGAKALSSAGFLAMLVGSNLGGELVFRLGTQVDRNAWVKGPVDFTPVMREAGLPPDRPTRVEANGVPLVLVRHGGEVYALNEVCSHEGGPLSEGHLEDGCIVCPWHGSTFKLEDGSVVHGPSAFPQPHHQVRIRNGQIEVRSAVQ